MGFLDRLFGKKGREAPKKQREAISHQLPSNVVCQEFGEVNVRKTPEATEVLFTILMEPVGADAEGWKTGVALDASGSMKNAFSANEVEPLARRMTAYLASQLDAEGGTTAIYWACGDGTEIEAIGDLTTENCETASFRGPRTAGFGQSTVLTPAVRYFVERFVDAKRGMYIFITDGQLHDLDEVKRYTTQLAKKIQADERNMVKCVLIGVGDSINEGQMEQLDDLETGTDVDIWDHKIAKEMRALVEIFAEVVSEYQIVAPSATIRDDAGNVVVKYADGLPAKVSFKMSPSSNAFELEVGGRRLRQTLISRKTQ